MVLNEWGAIAKQCWQAISQHLAAVRLDKWIIMPTHVHGIVWLDDNLVTTPEIEGEEGEVGGRHACPLPRSRT